MEMPTAPISRASAQPSPVADEGALGVPTAPPSSRANDSVGIVVNATRSQPSVESPSR